MGRSLIFFPLVAAVGLAYVHVAVAVAGAIAVVAAIYVMVFLNRIELNHNRLRSYFTFGLRSRTLPIVGSKVEFVTRRILWTDAHSLTFSNSSTSAVIAISLDRMPKTGAYIYKPTDLLRLLAQFEKSGGAVDPGAWNAVKDM